MTMEELKAQLELESVTTDPTHRAMWIKFVLDEVAKGAMFPVMIEGSLHFYLNPIVSKGAIEA